MADIQTQIIPDATRAKMNVEIAQHYLSLVSARHSDELSTLRRAVERGYMLMGISLTIASAGVGWLEMGGRWAAVVAIAAAWAVVLILSLTTTRVQRVRIEGRKPEKLACKEFVAYYREHMGFSAKRTYINLLCDQIDVFNENIKVNEATVNGLMKWYAWCIRIYIAGLLVCPVVWFLQ